MYCDNTDNKRAINIAHDPILHDMTKHVEIDRHFIKDNLNRVTCTPIANHAASCQCFDQELVETAI